MSEMDPAPPVADDDFPEFAGPPRHRPDTASMTPEASAEDESDERAQAAVDDVIARLRREREEGTR